MKKCLQALVIIIFIFGKTGAQNYSVALIPDSLKTSAHSVIREFIQETNVNPNNTVIERTKKVITVLDKEGEKSTYLLIPYDKDMKITINQILIYDANGKVFRKVKQSEIKDYPYSEYALFSDDRIKAFKPDYGEYPYTIEYDYESVSLKAISYGSWTPVDDYDISVQHALLRLGYPENKIINTKEINFTGIQDKKSFNNFTTRSWEINNMAGIQEEPFDLSIIERLPAVYLMPNLLLYDKYNGFSLSWKDYGKWMNKLYEGRGELPEALKLKINSLVNNIPDTLERMRILYRYMQENTRYVAVFLGIGGLQPFSAQTVFETGYGDCKALSNYLCAMLKYVGIKSYPAIVYGGQYPKPIFKDFPNFSQFNHVILCVPFKKDSIWVECTSQAFPLGFIGDFTDDRDVLLLTEDGGKLVHTKRYVATENIRTCNSYFKIDSTGTAVSSIKTVYTGLQGDDMIQHLVDKNAKDQKDWMYEHSLLPSLQINDFSFVYNKQPELNVSISQTVCSRNYGTFSGNFMLVPLNMINNQKPIQKMLKQRRSDILIPQSWIDYDTLVYQIPASYKPEALPTGKTINSKFGDYSSSVTLKNDQIIYTRKFQINEGRFSPGEYKDFYEFILSISKADNIKAMLALQK
ncbi:MAG TPA: DUF3857 domain-containing protein [Bacteroidales bacterium]|nr:DUF3857 domain-containing protein [Bacteroidales bacterium]